MRTTNEITRNLGGDRLGSGNKNNVTMHGYNRSNHDLSYAWRSTMNVGTLVPFMKLLELPGDSFSINLNAVAKTIPTIGPLYGAFKLQLDIFECPIRLYNGLLHNNMTKIGLNMAQVKLPKCIYGTSIDRFAAPIGTNEPIDNSQISSSALVKYLGLSGIGDTDNWTNAKIIERKLQCVPTLAYWDIYKNYYANKQEEVGVLISKSVEGTQSQITSIETRLTNNNWINYQTIETTDAFPEGLTNPNNNYSMLYHLMNPDTRTIILNNTGLRIYHTGEINNLYLVVKYQTEVEGEIEFVDNIEKIEDIYSNVDYMDGYIQAEGFNYSITTNLMLVGISYNPISTKIGRTILKKFDLKNIDDARIQILKKTGLGQELIINTDCNFYPYKATFETNSGKMLNVYPQNGLGIKTYQSDLLQNWLSTEWIDGENGINSITAIDTSSGSFQIDALNLANKVYNMLNRIAVSGGTYEDWQEAVFTANTNRRAETPIYRGGLAAEICFDEVISTAASGDQPLGTLAGRAVTPKEGIRGGQIEITCTEPAYIMGIVSITPRVDYSQGNDWDITELDTMDDLHKPALDGIGFEDLLQERAAWWGTFIDTTEANNHVIKKLAMGKTPAWMNYMTNVNKCYGEFASTEKMWMTINRRYEWGREDSEPVIGIKDLTTYVDPAKYNYAFAQTDIDAQNFWIQIGCEVKARRVMSAKILPNL